MPRRNNTPPHQRFQFDDNCRTKRQFKNQAQAQQAAEHQMLLDWNLELRVYVCGQCQFWHLTRAGLR